MFELNLIFRHGSLRVTGCNFCGTGEDIIVMSVASQIQTTVNGL